MVRAAYAGSDAEDRLQITSQRGPLAASAPQRQFTNRRRAVLNDELRSKELVTLAAPFDDERLLLDPRFETRLTSVS